MLFNVDASGYFIEIGSLLDGSLETIMNDNYADSKKVIVFSHNDQIHIYKCEQDLEEGTAVSMNGDDNQENVDTSDIDVNGAEVVTPTDEQ